MFLVGHQNAPGQIGFSRFPIGFAQITAITKLHFLSNYSFCIGQRYFCTYYAMPFLESKIKVSLSPTHLVLEKDLPCGFYRYSLLWYLYMLISTGI